MDSDKAPQTAWWQKEFLNEKNAALVAKYAKLCPMEKTVAQIDDPEQAYCAIKQKLASLMAKK